MQRSVCGRTSTQPRRMASRRGLGKTRHVESKTLVAAGGDQIGKSENEEGPGRATFSGPFDEGKSWREIVDLIEGVGGRMQVRMGNKGNEHG